MVSTLFERVVLGAAAATQCAKVHQTSQGFTVFLYNRYLGGGDYPSFHVSALAIHPCIPHRKASVLGSAAAEAAALGEVCVGAVGRPPVILVRGAGASSVSPSSREGEVRALPVRLGEPGRGGEEAEEEAGGRS